MLSDFVPGLIRLKAAELFISGSPKSSCIPAVPLRGKGDFGPICTSGIGGGLGRRGESAGLAIVFFV